MQRRQERDEGMPRTAAMSRLTIHAVPPEVGLPGGYGFAEPAPFTELPALFSQTSSFARAGAII
jgi:hypothetical protein